MEKYLAAAVFVCLSVPCLAATEFYVAQDPVAKDCKIVRDKPNGDTLIMIGTSTYPTRDAAKAAKRAAPECRRQGD